MVGIPHLTAAVLALGGFVHAQCGSGTPDAKVTGSGSSFTATKGSSTIYTGSDYRLAIQTALDAISVFPFHSISLSSNPP